MGFGVSAEQEQDHALLRLEGEFDLASAPLFDACVEEQLRAGSRHVRVDLGGLTFCDSTGLSAMIRARRACHGAGGSFVAFGAVGPVATVLQLTGLGLALTESEKPADVGSRDTAV